MSTARNPAHRWEAKLAGLDAHAISVVLAKRIDELAPTLLPSGRKEGATWRVGGLDGATGSSLAIALTGGKQGLWIDHATGEKGDALDLVKGARHCDYARGDRMVKEMARPRRWPAARAGAESSQQRR